MSGWGKNGENYGKGRWTQTQLHTGGKDKGEQKKQNNNKKKEKKKKKKSFILKLSPKTKSRQNGGKTQSSNQKPQGKVAT